MIEVNNLVKHYGAIRAVDGVSFKVKQGDILGFLGPNGAGKSTTMKMITGFITPTSGAAVVDGHNVLEAPIEAKKCIGYLPESAPVYGEMTVVEFLGFIAEVRGFYGNKKREKLERVVQLCHLDSVCKQSIETLSKGYRQRVGFAQALIHNPPVLVLDEPTDGLDPNQKREVRNLIKTMAKEKAIILSTHILEEVEALCNRVIIIAQGKVIVDETPDKLLKRNPKMNAIKLKVKGVDVERVNMVLGTAQFVDEVEVVDGACIVYPKDKNDISKQLLEYCVEHDWSLTSFAKLDARLDEVFCDLTTAAVASR